MEERNDLQKIQGSEEINNQLRVIRESEIFLLFFIVALLLSLSVTVQQETQLLYAAKGEEPPCMPDPCPPRLAAALLSFWALVFFYVLANNTLAQPISDEKLRRENQLSHTAALFSLLAGSIRLSLTLTSCFRPEAAEPL